MFAMMVIGCRPAVPLARRPPLRPTRRRARSGVLDVPSVFYALSLLQLPKLYMVNFFVLGRDYGLGAFGPRQETWHVFGTFLF